MEGSVNYCVIIVITMMSSVTGRQLYVSNSSRSI